MADVVDAKTRSRMMSGIGAKNTKPELIVRQSLFRLGFRYRLHRKDLPGKPDLVLPSYQVAVMVNGCFWHCHQCELFKWPKSNQEFWKEKLLGNVERDLRNYKALNSFGWHVLVVWECATRTKSASQIGSLGSRMAKWIESDSARMRIKNISC